MKRIIVMILVALFTISTTNAQTSGNKRNKPGTGKLIKCTTCGKLITACQYHGKHPKPTPKPNPSPGSKSEQTTTTSSPTPPNRGYINGHEWVDLGLSVKWATCNVGANSPSDYGGYYAWGETRTKSRYDWGNCFDCLDSTGDNWGIYKNGGQTRITPTSGHDSARANWGGTWRMPSIAECEELCNKCEWSWTSKDGHDGYLVTGLNGNSIFLPAADCVIGKGNSDPGKYGYYWSNTLTPDYSGCAQYLYICRDCSTKAYICGNGGRRDGFSIRPVTK